MVVGRGVLGAWLEKMMPTNLKKLVRDRMEKTGESYQTALRHVRSEVPQSDVPDIGAMLAAFRVGHISSVEVRRLSGARSATYAVAKAQAEDLAANPKWAARSETIGKMISRAEFDVLKSLGATERGRPQTIIVRHPSEAGLAFSVQCASCHLWIFCGESERQERCLCGRSFRVAFERTPEWTTAQLEVVRFNRCAGCGGELGLHPKGNPLGQWNSLTASMTACGTCIHSPEIAQWQRNATRSVLDDPDREGVPNSLYEYETGSTKGTVRAGTAWLAVLQVLSGTSRAPIEYEQVEWLLSGDTCAQGRLGGREVTATLAG
jgi:hypothetical protein